MSGKLSPVTLLPHSNYIRARRRINMALCILKEDRSLFTKADAEWLLKHALGDLDEAHLVERGQDEAVKGLDWNACPVASK